MSATAALYANPVTRFPLDESLYSLAPDEAEFFKTLTGIHDDGELKAHIIAAQSKAFHIFGYPCIRRFGFTKLRISRLPVYQRILELGRTMKDPILLDMACCFGNDIRKVVVDGWPVERAIASDLRRGFWDAGHQLFNSTSETFPVNFIEGDVFDSSMLNNREPFYELPSQPPPDLQTVTTLTPLQGHINAIHASSFFHLSDEHKQTELAHLLASLLSPLPGSVLFGVHGGAPKKGLRQSSPESGRQMFCHCPESWTELWDGQIFKKGTVKVEATLQEFVRPDVQGVWHSSWLVFSVTRL